MNNITDSKNEKIQISKIWKQLCLYLLVISLVLPSLTEVAWAAANPPEVMLRDNQVRAGEAPWKPDNYENGSDAAVMSRTGYCGSVGGARFRGSVKGIHYTEYKNAEDGFGWSRKPGGNDNYADELIRVNAKFDKNTKTIFWNIIVKGQSAGDLMGVTKDLTNPYFIIAISRGLENPKNLYVSNGYRKLKEYPNNWQTLHTGDFRMYDVYKDSDHALYNGRRILGKTDQTKEFLQEKYRLPCTGDNQDKSMAYNIEKYNYYSKYAIIDQQGGLNEANTRMYSFTTELDEGEVAAQGELPNVDSEFTNYMGWGGQRNNVDLSGKVWITVGVTSREARKNTAKPLGTGNYNFSKIAVVDVVPNKDTLGLEPYYNEGSGKAEETVKLPVNLKNSKKFPEGTRFMLESDPKDKFETNHSTGAITQTPAKPNGPISIDQYTGEVTVKIPKGAKGGEEIKDNVHVIYPDGSTHIVPLVVKVIEDKPNIKRGSFATNPKSNENQLDKVPFDDIYMGDPVLKYTYQAGDTSKIIKSFMASGLPSGTTFGVGTQESSNNAADEDHKRLERPLLLKADTKAQVGDFAITFKAVNGSGKETTATNPGVIKTYLPTNNGTKIRIKKGTPDNKIPSPEAAIGIYHKKYTNRDDIRKEMKTGIDKNLVKKDKTGYLPDGTTYTWKKTPGTDVVGKDSLYYAIVKYTDKTGKEVVDEVPVYVDVYDTDDVIAYTPNDVTKPTDDKDKNVPKKDSNKDDVDVKDYNLVAFRTEDKTKGTLTKDKEQNKEVISVLVKKNNSKLKTFESIKPVVNTATDYTFWFWDKDPANVKQVVADKDTYANKDIYTAYFIKSGDEIKEVDKNIPLPNGFHKVTVKKGTGIGNNVLFGKTYAVKKGDKLSEAKFPKLEVSDSAKFKNPAWDVKDPWTVKVADKDLTFTANAVSAVFDKTNVTKIEVIQDPTKMTYTEGDKPNHDGIKIKLTDKNGNTVEIGKSDLGTYGVTVTPAEDKGLTVNDNNGKPFVAKVNGKDEQGKAKELTANSKTNITVNPQKSNEDVIPYVPADKDNPTNPTDTNVPTKDKDGKTVDKSQYDIVAFKVTDADKDKGSLTLGKLDKQQVISALVKKGSKWEKVTVPTINVADAKTKANGYKPSIPATTETVKNGKVYEAQFVTNGQEITPGTKLPDGVFEVKVLRDENSIADNALYGKSYAVFKDSKLAQDKFPTPAVLNNNFKEPKWNVENPWDQAITKATEFKASAISSVFDKTNVTKIEVIQDPTKMTYTEGDKPNHDGIKIKLTDKNGNTVEIGKSDLGTYGVTVTPAEDKGLTVNDNNGKPFVAKVNGKDDQGKAKELTANSKTNITVNPQKSNEDVIPYVPADKDNPTNPTDTNVPTKDKDGKTVDKSQYDIVAFKVTDADKDKGSLTLGKLDKQQVISALVKKGSKWEKVTVPTINVADAKTKANGYKPSIPATTETVKNGKVYEAQFVTNGQEITPGTKLPDGVFEVKVLRDEASIKENALYGKSYAVFKDSKLAQDKFPTPLEVSDATKYKDPKWNVENPWDQAITKKTEFKASAISSVFDKDNVTAIEVIQDPTKMTYTEGDKPNHDGIKVKLTDKNGNTVEIEKGQLNEYGVTVTPAEDKGLTVKDNNGKPFVASVNDKDGNPLTANTRGTITVNDKPEVAKSEKPVITTPKAGDRTISGTGVPGAKVSVTKEDKGATGQGSPIAQDVLVGNDGKWTANVPDGVNLEEGDTVLATQKEDGKDESDQTQAKVKGKEDTTADPVIPFEPKNPENPGDKNDPKIPTVNPEDHKPIKRDEYVVVGFKVEPKDSGTLTLGKQENKAVISALVKKDTAWSSFTMPTPNNANNYVFWHWDTAPAGNVADGQVRVAKFIKSGDEINPNDNNPLPKDFHKVTVAKGTGIADNALFGKTYAVKKDATLAKDKFPELKVSDATQYKNPAWDVKDPWTVAVADKDLTFTANAVSAVFDKNNVTKMEVKTQPKLNYVEGNATEGNLDLSKLVVTLTDNKGNTQDVPFKDLGTYGITANPENGTAMTVDGNNGNPVKLTKDKLTANTENLVVTKDNTTDPVIPFEPEEDKSKTPIVDPVDDGDTSISGKGEPGSHIIINIPGKDPINTTVDDGGKWIYPIDPAHEGDVIKVVQKEVGKKPSDPAYVTVGGRSIIVPSHDDGGYWWFGGGSFKPVETEEQVIDKTEHGIHIAYIFGYKDHTFRCEGKITRAEAASMIAHIAKLDLSDNSKPDFKDTPSSWYNAAINAMVKKNLMFADKNGNFRPNEPITRGEFARAIQFIDKENKKEAPFMDIKGHEFEEAINQAYANGRIAGYPDGTFKPDESITRAEAVTILNNFDGRMVRERGIEDVKKDLIKFTDLKPSHWAYYEIIEASNTHAYSRISNDSKEEKWSNLIK